MPVRLVLAIVCACALTASTLGTAVARNLTDLRPALLLGRDIPRGFSAPVYKIFTRYTSAMTVSGQPCSAGQFKPAQWRQGIHEVIPKLYSPERVPDTVEVCGYLLKSAVTVSQAYGLAARDARIQLGKHALAPLKAPRLGDESIGAVVPFRNQLGAYLLVVRYGNAFLGFSYAFRHPPALSQSRFVSLARLVVGRLARGR